MAMVSELSFENLKSGMRARVRSVDAEGSDATRLIELGLTPGTEFIVTKVAPFGDPVEIDLRGYKLCLRRRETAGVQLEIID